MINKILTLSVFSIVLISFFSCNNPTKKNNEQKQSSNKVEISNESKENRPNDALSLKIGNYIKTKFLDKSDLKVMTKEYRKFQYSTIDLNGDNVDEIFVYLNSTYFCGSGGCTFLLLDSSLNLITKFTVTRTPILVDRATKNNWKKLYLYSDGGYREMIYDTKTKSYPPNPSLVEKVTEDFNNKENILKLFNTVEQTNYYY